MNVQVTTKVELTGPFFTRDPAKTIRENISDMLSALAGEMEAQVRSQIEAHASQMPGWTSWTRDHVHGYTTSPTTGKHWALWAAVAALTSGMGRTDAIRTKAAAAGIERRWHPFRRVKSGVYRARSIISADLSKGLN